MKELSNFDLDDYFKTNSKYGGCWSKDKIPMQLAGKNKFFVINLDNDAGPGTHWVALCETPKAILYADPFGMAPPENIVKFMKKCKKPMHYSDIPIQFGSSSSCGWFCACILNELSKGESLTDILMDKFSFNTRKNEKLLQKYFRK